MLQELLVPAAFPVLQQLEPRFLWAELLPALLLLQPPPPYKASALGLAEKAEKLQARALECWLR